MSYKSYEFFISNITLPSNQNDTRYQLINGTEIVEHNGTPIEGILSDIYYEHNRVDRGPWPPFRNIEDGTIQQHVAYWDTNSDWKLNTGDVILLLGAENDTWNGTAVEPGIADSGMVFRLIYEPNGEVIASIELT